MEKWNYALILMANEDGQNGTVGGIEPNVGGDKIVKGSRMRIIVMLETMGAQGWELTGLQEVGNARRYVFKRPVTGTSPFTDL